MQKMKKTGLPPTDDPNFNALREYFAKGLTRRCFEVLQIMRDEEEELVYEPGGGWWIGTCRTSGRIARRLELLCAISADSVNPVGSSFERHHINDTGLALLKTWEGLGYQ